MQFMVPEMIEGAQVELGREQGFVPLNIRYEMVYDEGAKQNYPSMICQLRPTPEAVAMIAAGEPIQLRILGVFWPPVEVHVGVTPYHKEAADTAWQLAQEVRKRQEEEQIKSTVSEAVDRMKSTLAGDVPSI